MERPGRIALAAVAEAERQVGVCEVGGQNRGPEVEGYLRAVGLGPGFAWCAAFVRFCLEAGERESMLGGSSLLIPAGFPDTGWADSYRAWAQRNDLWIPSGASCDVAESDAQRGDLACFWFEAKGRVAHVGLVARWRTVYQMETVEGNTGPTGALGEVEREGDGVYRKLRRVSDMGCGGGFVRIPW